MTWRRLLLAHVFRMAISTVAGFLKLLQLSFDGHRLWIGRALAVAMTRRAGVDGNVRGQSAQGGGARNVDMASRAFQDVLAFAAFVRELRGNPFRRVHRDERLDWLVTT